MKGLRSEREIMDSWKGDPLKPVVSVCCTTYNHELYIEDALRGFLQQETEFPYEIIVHDDSSTDKTVEIIKEYAAAYPGLIKTIFQVENQYSISPNKPAVNCFDACSGRYIAICEGDDYWISPDKLSLQVKLLSSSEGYMICAHDAYTLDAKGKVGNYKLGFRGRVCSVSRSIFYGGGLVPTASIVVDRDVMNKIRDILLSSPIGDWIVQALGAYEGGGVLFVDKKMSVYRTMVPGSWSSQKKTDLDEFFVMLDKMNRYMDNQYSKDICVAKKRLYYAVGRYELSKGNFSDSRYYIKKCLGFTGLLRKSIFLYILSFARIKV